MRATILTLLVVGLVGAAQPSKEAIVKKELELLEGTWIPTAVATDEGPKPLSSTKVERIVIKGDKWVMHEQGKQYEYTFTIDLVAKPKTINVTGTFNGQTFTSLAIYEVTAGQLMFANGGKERPSSFEKLPVGGVFFAHKRAKP